MKMGRGYSVLLYVALMLLALAGCVAAQQNENCTRSHGYWSQMQHYHEWRLPYMTEATCGDLWRDILNTPSAGGNVWFTLARQAIAAELNPPSLLSPAEATALGDAWLLLDANCQTIGMAHPDRATALALKDTLESFTLNNLCVEDENGASITEIDYRDSEKIGLSS